MDSLSLNYFVHGGKSYLVGPDRSSGFLFCKMVGSQTTDAALDFIRELGNSYGFPRDKINSQLEEGVLYILPQESCIKNNYEVEDDPCPSWFWSGTINVLQVTYFGGPSAGARMKGA